MVAVKKSSLAEKQDHTKFQIGDVVRIVKNDGSGAPIGEAGTIVLISMCGTINGKSTGRSCPYTYQTEKGMRYNSYATELVKVKMIKAHAFKETATGEYLWKSSKTVIKGFKRAPEFDFEKPAEMK